MSQPPTTPMQLDEPPSNQSQPSQNPIKQEQQPRHTAGSTSPSVIFVSVSCENEAQAAEQVTQYILQPYRNTLSQSNPDTNNEQVKGRPKVRKRRSAKRPLPTGQSFIPNHDPDKPPSIYVLVELEEFLDENRRYHCYESEELRSIASDEDADQPPVFPQKNADAPISQRRSLKHSTISKRQFESLTSTLEGAYSFLDVTQPEAKQSAMMRNARGK
ncbi:hypothetical protein Ahy_A01g003676 isoform A [Arachis hypogaea]|uniref:Uncharacterized protein n=1 Tax=Arachis hypogaea TaxID=3818 RepID=A0A445ETI4_ARAHY|nr:hypothetical protein Ahy_A01g003676 isoform A [Arachis hypogaea]